MTHNKKSNIEGLEITTLKIISTNGGDVLHGINVNDKCREQLNNLSLENYIGNCFKEHPYETLF